MLWPAMSLEVKFIIVITCAVVMVICCLIVICFVVPEAWHRKLRRSCALGSASDEDDDVHLTRSHGNKIRLERFGQIGSMKPDGISSDPNGRETSNLGGSSSSPTILQQAALSCCSAATTAMEEEEDCQRQINFSSGQSDSSSSPANQSTPSNSRSGSAWTIWMAGEHHQGDTPIVVPQLHLSLQWVRLPPLEGQEGDHHQLIVEIERGSDLPARPYALTVDPCISSVRLERHNKSWKRAGSILGSLMRRTSRKLADKSDGELVAEASMLQEVVVHHSRNPRFHHTVTFNVPLTTSIQDCQLVVKLTDNDRLVGTSELGLCRIELADLLPSPSSVDHKVEDEEPSSVDNEPKEEAKIVRLSRPLQRADWCRHQDKGDILLGLSFLPTSQRIAVQVVQVSRPASTGLPSLQALIRLYLLNESGRVLKKRKTVPRDYCPGKATRLDFDEHFHLDLDIDRWERSVILAVFCCTCPSSGEQQKEGDETKSLVKPIGYTALGKKVQGQAERIHWNSAFQNPRRIITQWHSLL